MPKVVAPIVVIVLGLLGAVALVRSKAPVEIIRPVDADPLVRVVTVRFEPVPLTVTAHGTVLPRTETTLAAQVAAEVVAVSPRFETGAFVERGEALVRLDRRDFELAVERAAAKVAQAELRLVRQQAEARVAAEEWRALGDGEPDPLVLGEPQMAEARAMLKAAEADFGMARLALERTVIRAPFDGRLRSKAVDVGQYVTPGQEVARVHAIDFAEVRLPVSDRHLAFLDLPLAWGAGTGAGPEVRLSARFTGGRHAWPGRIVRADGELDRKSRMLHLVARVEDPYGRRRPDRPPLAVGLFVDAEITGRTVVGALLPRSALRGESQVLVVDAEDRLRIRDVELVRIERDVAVIGGGLEDGERVCVSPMEVVVDGMQVRTTGVAAPILPTAETAAVEAAAVEAADDPGAEPPPAEPAASPPTAAARFAAVTLADGEATAFEVAIGGTFDYSTSRLGSPERFVLDLLGVIKANPRSAVEVAGGPVERVRIAQYQAGAEPIVRLVFDLRADATATVERRDAGLAVTF